MADQKSGVDRLILRQLEAFIIGLLKPFTIEDLQKAVKGKALLISMIPKDFKTRKMVLVARNLAKKASPEELAEFNVGTIASWVVTNRPETLPYFEHDEIFVRWFRINIKAIRKYLGIDI